MVVAAAATLCASTVAASGSASAYDPETNPEPVRYAGDNRYETAALIADEWGCGDATVVSGENWPDGLAASVLDDRILLVTRDSIPAATQAYFEDCDSEDITIVGGPAAVSSAVLEALEDYDSDGHVQRIAGADRYATALEVARSNGTSGCVLLATGMNFPDALAGG
ncbi:MAG TPA: cell wall-binding repeat-containing protein, partial [Ilumatobacter sp.]